MKTYTHNGKSISIIRCDHHEWVETLYKHSKTRSGVRKGWVMCIDCGHRTKITKMSETRCKVIKHESPTSGWTNMDREINGTGR